MRIIAETLMKARASILNQIKVLDRRLMAISKAAPVVRLFMTAPGVGVRTSRCAVLSPSWQCAA